MPPIKLPPLPSDWVLFADWSDLYFGTGGLLLVVLLTVWWRQQIRGWLRLVVGTFLLATLLSMASLYVFAVPAHYVGCPQGCSGWLGYPLPFAAIDFAGRQRLAPVDFGLNVLLLWLLWLVCAMVWRLLALGLNWQGRSLRSKSIFILLVFVLPWAFLPRFLEPPQPRMRGEDLRLAINAQRIAQFTYSITGVWVQRLALEDIRHLDSSFRSALGSSQDSTTQVCLRGYTYFYVPWRRYRLILDTSGVLALNLTELDMQQPCW